MKTYRLHTGIRAVVRTSSGLSIASIPEGTVVRIMTEADSRGMVDVRFEDQVGSVFEQDVRERGEMIEVFGASA